MEFGPFDGLAIIGRGASSEVWSARHRRTGWPAAVKVLLDREFPRAEVRVAASLHHPHVVALYELGTLDDGRPWIAMERASGGPVSADPRPWTEVRALLVAVLEGLAHFHAHGLVHRDVKLSNLLVATVADLRPGPKLADFGIAVTSGERARAAGSPQTMAPEQIRAEPKAIGPWTDLYAVGVVAHQLVTGVLPLPGRTPKELLDAHLAARPTLAPARMPVPAGLPGVLLGLLRKDPGDRYQRAADVVEALLDLGEVEGPAAPVTPRPAPTDAPRSPATFAFDGPDARTGETFDGEGGPPPAARPAAAVPPADAYVGSVLRDVGAALIPDRSPPLLARSPEVARVWRQLALAAAGSEARVVLVTGPAGVGKSHLARWVALRAEAGGQALALELDRPPAEAVAALPGLRLEGDPARGLARWAAKFGPADPALLAAIVDQVRRRASNAEPWLRLAAHVSTHRPVLVVLEPDLDPAVASFVDAGLLVRLRARVTLVVAVRAPPARWVELADDVVELAPIGPVDAARALDALLPMPPHAADGLLAEAGSLGAAVDLLRRTVADGAWVATGAGHVRRPIPPAEVAGSEGARWIAAFGGDVGLDALAAVADPEVEPGRWRSGRRARMPLAEARAICAADPERERRTAATLAWWLDRGDLVRAALVEAAAGLGEAAVARLVACAEAATTERDYVRIEGLLARIGDPAFAPGTPRPLAVELMRGALARLEGRHDDAERALAGVLAVLAPGDALEGRALVNLALLARDRGQRAEVEALLDRAVAAGGEWGLVAEGYRLEARRAGPEAWADHLASAGGLVAPHQRAYLQFRHAFAVWETGADDQALALALAALDEPDLAPSGRPHLLNLAGACVAPRDPARARGYFEASSRAVDRRSPESFLGLANLAELDGRELRWADARRRFEEALWIARRLRSPHEAQLHASLAWVLCHLGLLAEAAAHVDEAVRNPGILVRVPDASRVGWLAEQPDPVGARGAQLRAVLAANGGRPRP